MIFLCEMGKSLSNCSKFKNLKKKKKIIIKAIMRQHKQLFTKPQAFTDFLDSLLWIVVGALQAQIPPGFGKVNAISVITVGHFCLLLVQGR